MLCLIAYSYALVDQGMHCEHEMLSDLIDSGSVINSPCCSSFTHIMLFITSRGMRLSCSNPISHAILNMTALKTLEQCSGQCFAFM